MSLEIPDSNLEHSTLTTLVSGLQAVVEAISKSSWHKQMLTFRFSQLKIQFLSVSFKMFKYFYDYLVPNSEKNYSHSNIFYDYLVLNTEENYSQK